MRLVALTHPGWRRAENQDRVVVDGVVLASGKAEPVCFNVGPNVLVAVIDGMGGHPAGGVAAALAADVMASGHGRLGSAADVGGLVSRANDEIYTMMNRVPGLVGMGATVAGVAAINDELVVFNVGDARVYLEASGYLIQASIDDRPPGGGSGAISQSLGGLASHTAVDVHLSREPRQSGRVLVASDGLFTHSPHEDLAAAMNLPLPGAAEALLRSALDAGGEDNVSIALLDLSDGDR